MQEPEEEAFSDQLFTSFPEEESQIEPGAGLAARKPQSSSCLHPYRTGGCSSRKPRLPFYMGAGEST